MAETLRELVVSLSLQSDNFSKNIKSINAQIREVESRFNQAGAGVDGFAKSTDGLKAKAASLAEKLELQKTIVGQYEQSLKKATDTLEKNKAKHETLKTTLTDQKAKYAALKAEMDKAEAAHKASIKTTGDNSEESVRLGVALEDLKTEYSALGDEIKKNEGELSRNTNTLRNNADTVSKTSDGLNKAVAAEKETRAELEKTNRAIKTHQGRWEAASKSLKNFGENAKTAGQNLSRAGQLLTASITAPLVALGGYAVKASIDAESAFAGVRKTVDMTEEEFARLDKTIAQMSTTKPASYTDIASLAETGGQLGIANDNLEMFVSTMTDLGVATNLVGQEGAAQLAKFANITGMSQANFDRLGATIVELGNNMATTEADIMAMSMRLGAAGSQVGLSESQILAFSAALSSVGIEAEAGGSAFSKAMIGMELAVVTGKNGLEDYAKVAGMSSAEFQKAWRDDAAGAIQAFIVGLSNMSDEGVSTIKVLDDMGFKEVRLRDTLMRATNASGLFANAQKISSGAWKENTALATEAEKRYGTTESRMTMLKNRTTALARTFGDDLSPAFGDIIDRAGEWIDNLAEMDAGQRQTILTTAAWLAAIGPGIMLIGKMNTGIGNLATGLGGLMGASVKAGGGLKGLFAATSSLLGPAGIAVLAGAAIYGAWKWYDYASGAKAAREATEAMMKTAEDWKNTQAKTIFDTGNDPLGRFGLSKESFSGGQTELEDWLGRLTETWTDGKKETNEIVKGYVDEFNGGSDKIREAIKKRQQTQEKYGVTGDQTTEDDLKKLQAYDKEVEALLKKRKNGKLTEDDQKRLEQVIEERTEIQLKYVTGEGGGYDSLIQAVEAEKARLAAEAEANGKPTEIGSDLYGDALTGAAQGYQTQVEAINQSYRDQYADIQAITDEKEREAALTQLNTEHTLALKKAQEEYNAVVGKYAPEAFETPEVQEAAEQMQQLLDALGENPTPEALADLTKDWDEGKLASYVALLKQLEESNLGNVNLGKEGEPVITASDLLGGYDTIADYLKDHTGTLPGLAAMLEAAGEEANRVLVDMALTPEGQTLKDWIDGHEDFVVTGTLTAVTGNGETFIITDATINADGTLTGVTGDGKEFTVTDAKVLADGTLTGVDGNGNTFTVTGATVTTEATLSGVTGNGQLFEVSDASATINASITPTGLDTLALMAWAKENGTIDLSDQVNAEIGVKFGASWKGDVEKAWEAGKVKLYDGNGLPIDIDPDAPNPIGKKDLIVGLEDDETIHVVVNPEASGDPVAIEYYLKEITEGGGEGFLGFLAGPTASKMDKFTDRYKGVDFSKALFGGPGQWEATRDLAATFDETEIAKIGAFVAEITAAINNGEPVSQEALDKLQTIKDFAATLETLGIGEDIVAGIGQGMKEAGWDSDAGTVADNLENALRAATGSQSPATKFIPIGTDIAAGVAKGIDNGAYKVKAAMVRMAEAALKAARGRLQINSPSRVMRDEVGVMMARGIGEGVLAGSKDQERIVANAARQMGDAALGGANYDNRRTTYNQQSTVSLAGANLYIRDDQDIYALATEIAALTKRQQRGRGIRR